MSANALVRVVSCSSAREFIDAISPLGTALQSSPAGDEWIFRGHGDDDAYKLVASALRPEETAKLHQLAGTDLTIAAKPEDIVSQWLAEALIINRFISAADDSGQAIPEDSQSVRSRLSKYVENLRESALSAIAEGTRATVSQDYYWPDPRLFSQMALAQHYGLPTRLLDWTCSPYTAAYFAATDACVKPVCGQLSVWAYRTSRNSPSRPIRIVRAPRAWNPNLNGQDGLFTLYRGNNFAEERGAIERRPMDELLVNGGSCVSTVPLFCRFTVPSERAGEVLWFLNKYRVNASRLFPSFDGAVKAMREEAYHRAPSP